MVGLCRGGGNELAGDLAAGANEAYNIGVEGQLALEIHLLLEQLQRPVCQPCTTTQRCCRDIRRRHLIENRA